MSQAPSVCVPQEESLHTAPTSLNRCFSVLSRADLVRPQSAIIFINQTYWLRLNGTLPLLDFCFASSIRWHFPPACIEINMFLVSLLIKWPCTNRMRLQSPHAAPLSPHLSLSLPPCLRRARGACTAHVLTFPCMKCLWETKRLLALLPGCVLVGGSPIMCPCTIARVGSALGDIIRLSELWAAT